MSLERNLPENRQARLDRQVIEADDTYRRVTEALWHVERAIASFIGSPQRQLDPTTEQQAQVLRKCLQADQRNAQLMQEAAIRCAGYEDETPEDEMELLRKAGLSNGRP